MSVVVFDGFELVGDQFMGAGAVMSSCVKVGHNEQFFWGFVGSPSIAQYMLSKLQSTWGESFDEFNEWSMNQSDRVAVEEATHALVIAKDSHLMLQLAIGLPVLQLEHQPYYIGADDGQGIFNYCKALNVNRPFARECVGMCITASSVSCDPFATGPSVALTVNPFETLQG